MSQTIGPPLLSRPDFQLDTCTGWRRCETGQFVLVFRFTHDIEAVSCDEMFVDLTDLIADTGASPEDIAALLREEIYEKTKCTASAGMGKFFYCKTQKVFHLTPSFLHVSQLYLECSRYQVKE